MALQPCSHQDRHHNRNIISHSSFFRSAVNANAGAKSVVSNIIMASTGLIRLMFLISLFHYTPNLILAAIIVMVVTGLIANQNTIRLLKVDKLDFVACLSSFFSVLLISVPIGLACNHGRGFGFQDITARDKADHWSFRKHPRDSDLLKYQ